MPEHLIRLRGPWELLDLCEAGDPSRLDLPTERLPGSDCSLVLRRRFGRPTRLASTVACRLRVEDVPGLLRVALNGTLLMELPAGHPDGPGVVDLPIGPALRSRNLLELTVTPGPSRSGTSGRPWGSVALAFVDDRDRGG